jgi:hypothetical protein
MPLKCFIFPGVVVRSEGGEIHSLAEEPLGIDLPAAGIEGLGSRILATVDAIFVNKTLISMTTSAQGNKNGATSAIH